MIRQVLLSLPTWPDSPPQGTLEGAAVLAQSLGASLTALLPQLSANPETWPAIIGTFPLDFPHLMKEAVLQSEANAATSMDGITRACATRKVALDLRRCLTTLYASPNPLVDLARLHDLTILPMPQTDALGGPYMQAALFGAGRPTLLLPSGENSRPLQSLDRVVLAWDWSREAARAMADALPILARASKVHVLSVFGEKSLDTTAVTGDLEKYLASHGIEYVLDRTSFTEGDIGRCILSHARDVNADLLVMGAYGHSRLREFVLGGATRTILTEPQLPVLVSH